LKVLVTAVGGDLAQSVVKCLKDSKYKPVVVGCDSNPYAGGRGDVDIFFQAPPVNRSQDYQDFLGDVISRQKIRYVFPLSEQEIHFYHTHRDIFLGIPVHFIVQSTPLIETFMDKYKTVQYFKSFGLPFPQTWLPEEYEGQSDFPLILKKRSGSGGKGLILIRDAEELRFQLSRQKNMVIQEYLAGEDNEFTSGLFGDGEKKYSITFKRELAPGGFSRQVELVKNERITSFPCRVAEVLDFRGSLNIQFRMTERGCVPLEINPRFSSTVYFRHCFGFKDVEWSLDILEGKTFEYKGPIRKGVGVRKFGEIFFDSV
jgi:carbamoyl-phosphate synthase large subunit